MKATGERFGVILINHSQQAFQVEVGMKIAQMVIQPVIQVKVEASPELDIAARGEKGFGSTGFLVAHRGMSTSSCWRSWPRPALPAWRFRWGAVIVKNKQVLATGYNGPPSGSEHCISQGFCYPGLASCDASKESTV